MTSTASEVIKIEGICIEGRNQVHSSGQVKASHPVILKHIGLEFATNEITGVQLIRGWEFGMDWVPKDDDAETRIIWHISANYGIYQKPATTKDGTNPRALPSKPINIDYRDINKATSVLCATGPKVNPVKEWILSCPEWDRKRRIDDCWERQGAKLDASSPYRAFGQSFPWLELVRHSMYPGSHRFVELIYISDTGCGKSSFIENMLPSNLREEYWDDKFEFSWKDDKRFEMMTVSVMENKEMPKSPHDWDVIKSNVDKRTLKKRKMWSPDMITRWRADTIIHTTNEAKLPDTDLAIHNRFIVIRIEKPASLRDKDNSPWVVWNDLVDPDNPSRGTIREQMIAEAKHRMDEQGTITTIQGKEFCNWNPTPPDLRNEELKRINNLCMGGVYNSEKSDLIAAVRDAIHVYEKAGKDGWKMGALYDKDGNLYAINQTGFFYMASMLARGDSRQEAMIAMKKDHLYSNASELSGIRSKMFPDIERKRNAGGVSNISNIIEAHTGYRIKGPAVMPNKVRSNIPIDADDFVKNNVVASTRWVVKKT